VSAEKGDKLFEIPAIRNKCVRRDIALFLQVDQILFHRFWFGHRATGDEAMFISSIHCLMSVSARSARSSRFFFLSRTLSGRSSTRPKFAFIGWKCLGSASRMYR